MFGVSVAMFFLRGGLLAQRPTPTLSHPGLGTRQWRVSWQVGAQPFLLIMLLMNHEGLWTNEFYISFDYRSEGLGFDP